MNASSSQIQARFEGKQEEAVKFLSKHRIIALVVFILAIVSAGLWGEVVSNLSAKIYGVKKEELELWQITLTAIIFTIITYILIVHVIKVPITAAFSL